MTNPDPTRVAPPSVSDRPEPETVSGPADSADRFAARLAALAADEPDGGAAPPGFVIERELGRGGMGVVYLARDVTLNRLVALKRVLADDRAGAVRFLAEAEAAAAIRHPHVAQVYAYGEFAGRPYMSLEYVPGGTLAARLRPAGDADPGPRAAGARLDPAPAAALVAKLAAGVAAAHEAGIVHRDLKPANVLLTADGEPKVADFGLAKRQASALTATQAVMGTPSYMAPEQAGGRTKFVGPPADVWALGVILYECLTGLRPFPADTTQEVLTRVMFDTPARPRAVVPAVPRDLELICLKCLAKEPGDRYPTARELADDLDRFGAGRPVSARPLGPVESATRWAKKNPVMAALLGVVAAVSVGLAGSLVVQTRQAVERADAEARAGDSERRAREAAEEAARVSRQAAADEAALRAAADDEAAAAKQVADFMSDLFRSADPLDIFGDGLLPQGWEKLRTKTANQFLVEAADRIRVELKNRPVVRAKLLVRIGKTMKNLGMFPQAEAALRESLDLRRRQVPPNHLDTAESEVELARLHWEMGDFAAARDGFRAAIQTQTRGGADERDVMTTRLFEAAALSLLGDPAAEAIVREVVQRRTELLTPHHRDTVFAKLGLAGYLIDTGRADEVTPLMADLLAGVGHLDDGQFRPIAEAMVTFQMAMGARSTAVNAAGPTRSVALAGAEALFRKSLDRAEKCVPKDHYIPTLVRYELGVHLELSDRGDEAERLYREVTDSVDRWFGLAHPKYLIVLETYADRLRRTGKAAEARELFARVDAANLRQFKADNFWRLQLLLVRVQFEVNDGEFAAAARYGREAADLIDKGKVIANRATTRELMITARELASAGATAEAREAAWRLYAVARPVVRAVFGDPSRDMLLLTRDEGWRRFVAGDRYRGAALVREADAMAALLPKPLADADAARHRLTLGRLADAEGQPAVAEGHFAEALARARKLTAKDADTRADAATALAGALMSRGDAMAAVPLLEEARKQSAGPAADRRLALAKLAAGDEPGYRAAVAGLLKAADAAVPAAWAAGLVPGVSGWDAAAAARGLPEGHRARARALVRAGDARAAEAVLAKPARPIDHAIRGLAALARGDADVARAALRLAEAPPAGPFPFAGSPWEERATARVLLTELRANLASRAP